MAKFRVERDGQTFEVDVPDGQDPTAALESAIGGSSAATRNLADDALPAVGDAGIPTSIDEAISPRREGRSLSEDVTRGLGLGARTVAGAATKLPATLADLAAMAVNLPIAGLDKAAQALGDEPITARLPTGSTGEVDTLLNEIFPEPEGFGEEIISGAGELALTGVAGGAALAPKVAAVIGELIPAIKGGRAVPGILESIGLSASKSPKTFAGLESSGAVGAEVAADLAADADAGPAAQVASTLAGGLAGIVAPQAVISGARRTATGALNLADTVTKGEVRAAKTLQEAAADPQAAAKAARDAPEGVLPARATGDPKLQAKESRVLADDPALELRAATDLEAAEQRSLQELADSFGPTSSKGEFQQAVIERAAAPGATIKAGQPDEMLSAAARTFNKAYKGSEGFPIQTQTVAVEGGNVPLRESVAEAINDPNVFTTPAIQKRVLERVEARLTSLESGGTPVPGSTAVEVDSADILTLRSQIRAKERQLSKSGATNPDAAEEAELLGNVNRALTDMLESQLPADAATALRAVDARYTDFITVQGAVLRSGEKGLTPEALRASVKARTPSQGKFAQGEVGDLGKLAEQGKDIATTLAKGRTPGKPDQAARITRDMTPEQLQTAKADLGEGLAANATSPTTGRLDGKKLVAQVESNREVLTAAGFTKDDIGRIERIGKALQVMQARSPQAADKLLEDNVGLMLNLFARIAGSKSGSRVLKFFGGAGVGGSLILTQFGSKQMQGAIKGLSVDKADKVLRAAFDDKELFAALMVRPTDSLKRQAEAARTFKAFLLEPAQNQTETEND